MTDLSKDHEIWSVINEITSTIAWWYKQKDEWVILILDQKGELEETIEGNRKIIPLKSEQELLMKFLETIRTINPDILVGYNSDYFDIPYLYYRMCNIFDQEIASMLSPIGWVRDESQWNDNSANALTKSIIAFLQFSGCQAERINTMGVYRKKYRTDGVAIGGQWTKGTGTPGSADISAT